jgi:flavin reductase (DIM6/NTAB) family NADH-FMN oxidoreductase RutF
LKFDIEQISHDAVYKLMIGLIAPRPIALITSQDEEGRLNAAPFSAFNYFGTDPPIIGVGVANRVDHAFVPKDTAHNITRTGEFVVNVVTEDIAEKMNICAVDFPRGTNEMEIAGLTTVPSQIVRTPRIEQAHAALECREHTTLEIGRSRVILGRVVAIYVEDRFVDSAGPYIKAEELHAIGRMNGLGNYVRTRDAFLKIPRVSYTEWKKKHG